MPISPRKGESQADFMSRCVPEMMGEGGGTKRPREQAVAACLTIWNDATKRAGSQLFRTMSSLLRKADVPEPDDGESHDDFIERCTDELADSDMGDDDAEYACQLSWDEWNADDGEAAAPSMLTKTHSAAVAGMEFILSDSTSDRYGDVIEASGWDFKSFLKNPIALFNHDRDAPIGKWANVRIAGEELRGDLLLAPKGTSRRIDEIRRLVEADILRAVSVGFRPLEHEPINAKDPFSGRRYIKSELVETSLVAVPANPNAIAVAKAMNISDDTVRLVFGEHADQETKRRETIPAVTRGGEHAGHSRGAAATGEHAEKPSQSKGKIPMLLTQRIQAAEKHIVGLQDQLDTHLGTINDEAPTDEQMMITEDLTAKIEAASRNISNLKTVEARNGSKATDVTDVAVRRTGELIRMPAGLTLRMPKKPEPLDFLWRALHVRARAKSQGEDIDVTRQKIYGNDEATKVVCDIVLKAASAPAMTTVTGWAAELVQQIYADFMEALLPISVLPQLSAKGLSLSFGAAGRIVIPTRNLTPAISGSFVGEGAPIPVRQGAFASQTLVPKKAAVITTWTKEMDDHSTPAIEGLLRQAILEDTAIALDAVLLDNNVATTIRPPGLRSYGAGLTPTAGGGFVAFVGDMKLLLGALLTATNGNVRSPVLIMNTTQAFNLYWMQPTTAVVGLFPFRAEVESGRLGPASLITSSTVPAGQVIAVDAADFVVAGAEGPRLEVSDTATLHLEDTAPADIVSGPAGTPVAATPVKSMWQTDSLALRMILKQNWLMRRPVVSWMAAVTW
jgi:HK97 family phage prohead protease/HK97 family phage major capsid protein